MNIIHPAISFLCLTLTLSACAASGGEVVPGEYVSKSRGVSGGIVLLWPRIYPKSQTEEMTGEASALQERLRKLIGEAFPERALDMRPPPERVCPRAGCEAASVGVLIVTVEGGCAAVLQVSGPGQVPAAQTPWAGLMTTSLEVPFREPPESHVKMRDFVPCERLLETTKEREAKVLAAIRKVASRP